MFRTSRQLLRRAFGESRMMCPKARSASHVHVSKLPFKKEQQPTTNLVSSSPLSRENHLSPPPSLRFRRGALRRSLVRAQVGRPEVAWRGRRRRRRRKTTPSKYGQVYLISGMVSGSVLGWRLHGHAWSVPFQVLWVYTRTILAGCPTDHPTESCMNIITI